MSIIKKSNRNKFNLKDATVIVATTEKNLISPGLGKRQLTYRKLKQRKIY